MARHYLQMRPKIGWLETYDKKIFHTTTIQKESIKKNKKMIRNRN